MIWSVTPFLTLLCKDSHVICTITGTFLAPVRVGIIIGKLTQKILSLN